MIWSNLNRNIEQLHFIKPDMSNGHYLASNVECYGSDDVRPV
uniref:Uncharacterized protein n=1 Tax=Dulem virus 42 TaxID=3145760 RepID=A0AAU8B7H2_9CAUD